MYFNEEDLSIKEQEEILKEATQKTIHKQYFDSLEFEKFTTKIKLSFPEELKYSKEEEKYFIFLFSQTKSITKQDKISILNKFSTFSVFQITELLRIIEEEKTAFNLIISKKPSYISKVSEMKFQTIKDWQEIESLYVQKKTKTPDKRFYGIDFYARPYDIEQILRASKVENQYFFGGVIRARDGFLEQITYVDELPLDIVTDPCLYHAHEDHFEKRLNKYGIKLRQINYFRNKDLGKILTELNINGRNFEKVKVLLKLKKQGIISKFLNYLLFS